MSCVIKGTAASPGIAIAQVFIPRTAVADTKASNGQVINPDNEWARYSLAVEKSRNELKALRERTIAELGALKAEIFDAHLSILNDPELSDAVANGIKQEGLNASDALRKAAQIFIDLLASMEDELFSARIDDIRDLTGRICAHLDGTTHDRWEGMDRESIIFAEDLSPSETTQLNRSLVKGFITMAGSRTSHSSILARSMEIPAVVGTGTSAKIENGSLLIIDGNAGVVIVDPSAAELSTYRQKLEAEQALRATQKAFAGKPSRTRDGATLELAANIGGKSDLEAVIANGAEGVGLFRTEFMYMDRPTLPGEDEQFEIYKAVLHAMEGKPVVIRTLDIGGDKQLACLPIEAEMNPFLGVRAIRLCLVRQDVFRTQLRALLRASIHGSLRIMFPMIATIGELRGAKRILAEERAKLSESGVVIGASLEVGIMIEIPAAAIMADSLAREADFFSIGTNDLIQYTMAADRMNPQVSYLYQPLNPAILRLIDMVSQAAHRNGRWLGICGEMASDPLALPLLVGLGLDELSMSATAIPGSRARLADIDRTEAAVLAKTALNCETAEAVRDLVLSKQSPTGVQK